MVHQSCISGVSTAAPLPLDLTCLPVSKTVQRVEKVAIGVISGPEPGSKCPKTGFRHSNGDQKKGTKEFFNSVGHSRKLPMITAVSGRLMDPEGMFPRVREGLSCGGR